MYYAIHLGPISWNSWNSESMLWVRKELPTSNNIHCGHEKASWKIHFGQPKRWGKLFFLSFFFVTLFFVSLQKKERKQSGTVESDFVVFYHV